MKDKVKKEYIQMFTVLSNLASTVQGANEVMDEMRKVGGIDFGMMRKTMEKIDPCFRSVINFTK